jgi:uncharacterized protein YjiS (DUF1127 family)
MHTLTSYPITWAWPSLIALRTSMADWLQRRHDRAQARRAAQAFERLDDRTLRDLGFHRCDAPALGFELHGVCTPTFRRTLQRL